MTRRTFLGGVAGAAGIHTAKPAILGLGLLSAAANGLAVSTYAARSGRTFNFGELEYDKWYEESTREIDVFVFTCWFKFCYVDSSHVRIEFKRRITNTTTEPGSFLTDYYQLADGTTFNGICVHDYLRTTASKKGAYVEASSENDRSHNEYGNGVIARKYGGTTHITCGRKRVWGGQSVGVTTDFDFYIYWPPVTLPVKLHVDSCATNGHAMAAGLYRLNFKYAQSRKLDYVLDVPDSSPEPLEHIQIWQRSSNAGVTAQKFLFSPANSWNLYEISPLSNSASRLWADTTASGYPADGKGCQSWAWYDNSDYLTKQRIYVDKRHDDSISLVSQWDTGLALRVFVNDNTWGNGREAYWFGYMKSSEHTGSQYEDEAWVPHRIDCASYPNDASVTLPSYNLKPKGAKYRLYWDNGLKNPVNNQAEFTLDANGDATYTDNSGGHTVGYQDIKGKVLCLAMTERPRGFKWCNFYWIWKAHNDLAAFTDGRIGEISLKAALEPLTMDMRLKVSVTDANDSAPIADGIYRLRLVAGDTREWDVSGSKGGYGVGALFYTADNSVSSKQRMFHFRRIADGSATEATYEVRPVVNLLNGLDNCGGGLYTRPLWKAQQSDAGKNVNGMRWRVRKLGDGKFTVACVSGGLMVGLTSWNATGELCLRTASYTDTAQVWRFDRVDTRYGTVTSEIPRASNRDLTGVTYTVYRDEGCSNPIGRFVCDKDGNAKFESTVSGVDSASRPYLTVVDETLYMKNTKMADKCDPDNLVYRIYPYEEMDDHVSTLTYDYAPYSRLAAVSVQPIPLYRVHWCYFTAAGEKVEVHKVEVLRGNSMQLSNSNFTTANNALKGKLAVETLDYTPRWFSGTSTGCDWKTKFGGVGSVSSDIWLWAQPAYKAITYYCDGTDEAHVVRLADGSKARWTGIPAGTRVSIRPEATSAARRANCTPGLAAWYTSASDEAVTAEEPGRGGASKSPESWVLTSDVRLYSVNRATLSFGYADGSLEPDPPEVGVGEDGRAVYRAEPDASAADASPELALPSPRVGKVGTKSLAARSRIYALCAGRWRAMSPDAWYASAAAEGAAMRSVDLSMDKTVYVRWLWDTADGVVDRRG